jgi:hypothetical protein
MKWESLGMSGWQVSLVIVAVSVLTILAAGLFWRILRPRRAARQAAHIGQAILQFRRQREFLEAKFFDLARASGKPRGLRWLECDWQNEVDFARACDSGLLTAFVSVQIRFEAIPGGDMEGIAAVDTLRDATAVFHFQNGRWETCGRVFMNMTPTEAVTRLAGQFARVSNTE